MAKRKTIAEIAAEVAFERGRAGDCNYCVSWGDSETLDIIAARATHTTILEGHPHPGVDRVMIRHWRVLNALENSSLFVKTYIRFHRLCRCFYLKDHVPDFMARN